MAALKLKGSGSSLQNISLPAKIIIGVVFLALVGAAYFVIFYGEIESDISSTRNQVASLQSELDEAKTARKAFNRDLAEVKRREQLVRKQKTVLPDKAETPTFLASVQTVATISGVNLVAWAPQDETPEDFYAKVPMQLELSGKFHQVARFFYGIGQANRIINIENITMKEDTKSRGSKKAKKGDAKSIELDETQLVKVGCLATAFRALNADDSGKRKKGKKKARNKGGRK
ncbi:MAG: type 4a pilus biogenesis protein PilO [Deltaproteobacteria bacterium]|jgi:type IV pilus assembly protein PilO|nr:type 4a pilus biogenesis protein PilO [Deltaproteobacteria bacterium]MBW2535228.1 type 4a pilus biogenesis protein PilO [Deltaproteobacteria bacterium]